MGTATRHIDLAELDRVIVDQLGRYNASVSWAIRHDPRLTADDLAELIADRDAPAVRQLTGRPGFVRDRDEWWPLLVAGCHRLLAHVDDLATA